MTPHKTDEQNCANGKREACKSPQPQNASRIQFSQKRLKCINKLLTWFLASHYCQINCFDLDLWLSASLESVLLGFFRSDQPKVSEYILSGFEAVSGFYKSWAWLKITRCNFFLFIVNWIVFFGTGRNYCVPEVQRNIPLYDSQSPPFHISPPWRPTGHMARVLEYVSAISRFIKYMLNRRAWSEAFATRQIWHDIVSFFEWSIHSISSAIISKAWFVQTFLTICRIMALLIKNNLVNSTLSARIYVWKLSFSREFNHSWALPWGTTLLSGTLGWRG